MSSSTYKEYSEVPAYEQATFGPLGNVNNASADKVVWAGKVVPPPIGEKIILTINSLGEATIVGYFVQDGYLGLRTKLDNAPEWYVKQNGGNVVGHVFGPEFKSKVSAK